MSNSKCTYNLDTKFVPGCDPCRKRQFKTKQVIRIGNYNLLITRIYEYKTCFEGFTHGNFLHALTLLPKEKQEVEVIRRSKYERALHEERSIESEFEHEFSRTLRLELSASQDFNFSQEIGGGFNLFGLLSGGASATAEQSFSFEQDFMSEVVSKTSARVSSKYDISIDTKTEVENKFRSLRTIENPNPCKVVTFFFKQLNKKFKFTLSLLSVKYDIILARATPQIHLENLKHYTAELDLKKTFEIEPLIYKNTAEKLNIVNTSRALNLTNAIASKDVPNPRVQYRPVNEHIEIHPKNNVLYKELTEPQLELKLKTMKVVPKSIKRIFDTIKKLKENPAYKPSVIYTKEYCLRTSSVITEPKVSECSICDCDGCDCSCKDEHPDILNLQVEKMKVEIELLKKQLEG